MHEVSIDMLLLMSELLHGMISKNALYGIINTNIMRFTFRTVWNGEAFHKTVYNE